MVPAHQFEAPSEHKEQRRSDQGKIAEGPPDPCARVLHALSPRLRREPGTQAHEVIFITLVFRDRAEPYAGALGLDECPIPGDHQGAVAPVRVCGIGAAEVALLSETDEARDEVMAVGEDE